MELTQQNYELAMQRPQYDILQERVTGAKQACHDLRQHLLLLSALLADQKYNELAEYIGIPDQAISVILGSLLENAIESPVVFNMFFNKLP